MAYAPKLQRRVPNLLDGADTETAMPHLASGSGGVVASGQPDQPTVQTNYGELDADAVVNNRVGGVGVVHILADKPNVTV